MEQNENEKKIYLVETNWYSANVGDGYQNTAREICGIRSELQEAIKLYSEVSSKKDDVNTETAIKEVIMDGKYHEKDITQDIKNIIAESKEKNTTNVNTESMEKEINTIDIAQLGKEIGMEVKEQTLPNGKVVKSLVWDQENLQKAVNAVKHLSEQGNPVRITGAAPAWLVSALTHAVHPCPVSVYMPQIDEDIDIPLLAHGETNTEGEVKFKVTEKGDSVLVEYEMDLPEGISTYDENNLPKVVVPEISQGKAVYLSGRGPNYLTVSIAESYAHTNSSVSLNQPGIGYTCSITHSRNKRLGDLTKDPLGKEEIKESLIQQQKTTTDSAGPSID